MNMSKALIATCGGAAIGLVAGLTNAGETYCTSDGPDVITYLVANTFGGYDMEYYGQASGVLGYAMASTAGNTGNMVSQWTGNGGQYSPVIAQNCYRIKDGRFEQIGLSWLKHSFCAVSEAMCSCQSTSCSSLGIGCADTYWAGLNADADAPRSEINATTGVYTYPFMQSPCGQSSIRGKLQINPDDVPQSGADYYIEVQYVQPDSDPDYPDEYDYDNQYNNVSWRQINFNSATSTSPVTNTTVMESAIEAWGNYGAVVRDVWTPEADGNIGLMHLGYNIIDNGNGTWTYVYAVHNQNSHNSCGSFSAPVSDCVEISDVQFHDVDYHSCEMVDGTDWSYEIADGYITWSTESYDQNEWANAIRWGTVYTFSFTADYPANVSEAMIGMWRDAGIGVEVGVRGPVTDCGDPDCPGDADGDGDSDVDDVLNVIGNFGSDGSNGGDVNNDGTVDVNDVLQVLGSFGDC